MEPLTADLSKLSLPELADLIRAVLAEIELRMMQDAH